MKQATLEQFVGDPRGFVETSQHERVVLLRDGKPVAILLGVEFKDAEDLCLQGDAAFWRMIEESRREPSVRLRDAEAGLFGEAES